MQYDCVNAFTLYEFHFSILISMDVAKSSQDGQRQCKPIVFDHLIIRHSVTVKACHGGQADVKPGRCCLQTIYVGMSNPLRKPAADCVARLFFSPSHWVVTNDYLGFKKRVLGRFMAIEVIGI